MFCVRKRSTCVIFYTQNLICQPFGYGRNVHLRAGLYNNLPCSGSDSARIRALS